MFSAWIVAKDAFKIISTPLRNGKNNLMLPCLFLGDIWTWNTIEHKRKKLQLQSSIFPAHRFTPQFPNAFENQNPDAVALFKEFHLSTTWWKSSNLIPPHNIMQNFTTCLQTSLSSAIKGFYGFTPSKRLLSNGWLAGGTIDQQGACICLGSAHGTGSAWHDAPMLL